jgi:hypothetical protein
MRKQMLCFVFLLVFNTLWGQNKISGIVLGEASKLPIEYVNIGIAGKNIGTVTDENGKFHLSIDYQFEEDSLLFSCIGYESYSLKISDIKEGHIVNLKEKQYDLNEVTVRPRVFKERILGVTTKSKMMTAGFSENHLGYECGILMKAKKQSRIKRVDVNIARCDYDTIFYRLNIYEVRGKNEFENILREPIYVNVLKKDIKKNTLQIDLASRNIVVDGNFLVTLEHIKDVGEGNSLSVLFPVSLKQKTYYRKTSQGDWGSVPIGISLSVVADVER